MSILSTVIDIVIICGPLIFYFPANFKEKAPSSQAQGFRNVLFALCLADVYLGNVLSLGTDYAFAAF